MARAVIFRRFGGAEVLEIVTVDDPHPGPGQIRVRVHFAGLNPVDYKLFAGGETAARYRVTLPSGNGHDFSGVVDEVGPGVREFAVGDRVYGGARFRAQADYVIVDDPSTLNHVPAGLPLAVAGALDIAGRTAVASVNSVGLRAGDVVLVTAAAGGVGIISAQLAIRAGARVVGTASAANHPYLAGLGITPVEYGPGVEERLRAAAPEGYTAMLDNHGSESIRLGMALGIPTGRINSVADRASAEQVGALSMGRATTRPDAIRPIAALLAAGELTLPVNADYPLERVVDAYKNLMTGHVRGKLCLTLVG